MDIQHLFRQAARLAALGGSLAAAAACGGDADIAVHEGDSTARSLPTDGPFGGAAITGLVRFVGTPPANPAIDMRVAPHCRAIYHSPPRQLGVIVNPNGTLANVFVYVKRGLPPHGHYAAPAERLLVTERGCQYHPRVVGLLVGQALALRNDDAVPHQIVASGVKTRPFTMPQAAGRSNEHVFRAAEVMVPLQCARHPWMRAYVGILPHPFFATTGDEGRFTISRLPPGTYTLEAWHEGYGRRAATVTVRDSTTQHVTFTYAKTASETSE
jgi:hypothetical protein